MSILRQACPSCGRTLELPAHAVGKTAKCPACEATFSVEPQADPATAGTEPGSGESARAETEHSPGEPQWSPLSDSLSSSTANPYADPETSYGPASANPYQASTLPTPVVRIGAFEVVDQPIEPVLSATLSIFGQRWAPVILSWVIVLVAMFAALLLPFGIFLFFSVLAAQWGPEAWIAPLLAISGLILLLPFLAVLSGYLTVGMTRVMLAVARNESSPLVEMMPPMILVGRFLLGGAVLFVLMMVVMGIFGLISMWAQAMGGNEIAMTAVSTAGTILGSIGGFLVQFWIWPWFYVVSDGKSTALGSIRDAYGIAMHNKLTSFLLVLCSAVLSLIGTLLCYVGQLITFPLSMLMFAVAYLLITNQPISDPRHSRAVGDRAAMPSDTDQLFD